MSSWDEYRKTMQRPLTLWDAARANDVDGVRRLLDEGAAIDAQDGRGHSALMLATYGGHREVFTLLVARGADVNSADGSGNSVLMGAAFKGHLDLVRELLAAGADVTARNASGMDAAAFAAMFGRVEVARELGEMNR